MVSSEETHSIILGVESFLANMILHCPAEHNFVARLANNKDIPKDHAVKAIIV